MGIFSFIKNAGSKLFGKKESSTETITAPTIEELNAEKAAQLRQAIADLQLPVDGLTIEVNDDTVILSGEVENQSDKEKIILTAGNVEGIAAVDDRMTVANPEPEAVFYEVKSGDSLSKIAKAQYGDPMKYPVIFEANKPMLKDPNLIYPGQVLRIPPLSDN